MLETLEQVCAAEYSNLWRKVPGSLGSILWIGEVAIFGWNTGMWAGAATVVVLTSLSRLLQADALPAKKLVDLCYATVMRRWPVRVLWLLFLVYLWLGERQSGWAVPMVASLYLATILWPFICGRIFDRVFK